MDGPALIQFSVGSIPGLADSILEEDSLTKDDVDFFLFHQATLKMLDLLIKGMKVDPAKLPIRMKNVGNTVSSTLPLLIHQLRESKELKPDSVNMLVGFGVGWSWAGCMWRGC